MSDLHGDGDSVGMDRQAEQERILALPPLPRWFVAGLREEGFQMGPGMFDVPLPEPIA